VAAGSIVVQPHDATVCDYADQASFWLAYSMPDVTFHWQFNDAGGSGWLYLIDDPTVSGSNNDTLIIHDVAEYEQFSFRCIIFDAFSGIGIDTSITAGLYLIPRPVVDFEWETPCLGSATEFHDLSSDPGGIAIVSWSWEFGDGNTSYRKDPTHIFGEAQTYQVVLSVWNDSNCMNFTGKQVEIVPFDQITIEGPEIVCSNEISNYREKYYLMRPYDPSRIYQWILPENSEEYIAGTFQINDSTLRIDWKSVDESTQVTIQVTESHAEWGCVTGNGNIDVLITEQQAPGQGKIVPKKEGKSILLYLGPTADIYQWGFTTNAFDGDPLNDNTVFNTIYLSNYCDFGDLDPNNSYWVETRADSRMECWTRTYYEPEPAAEPASVVKVYPNPVDSYLEITPASLNETITGITIYSITGVEMYQFPSISGLDKSHVVDVSRLSSGLYFCKIAFNTGDCVFEKFLVNHNK
jgi:PKD repeat protein